MGGFVTAGVACGDGRIATGEGEDDGGDRHVAYPPAGGSWFRIATVVLHGQDGNAAERHVGAPIRIDIAARITRDHGCVFTPEGLLRGARQLALSTAAPNPMLVEDSFEEAVVSDVWLCATESSLGILLDLRMSEAFGDDDLAVLILRNPTAVRWDCRPAAGPESGRPRWFWHTTLDQQFGVTDDGRVTAVIGLFGVGEGLEVQADRAELYVGDGELGQVPDMGSDGDDEIRRRLPAWSTSVHVRQFWTLP